ncbi:MBL fold metallo-hydrolase, partial [Arthrobacter sp. Cr_A7]|nr:MBL fold metallo-hydrolase [Arthrobacter sp. Cr_A7]
MTHTVVVGGIYADVGGTSVVVKWTSEVLYKSMYFDSKPDTGTNEREDYMATEQWKVGETTISKIEEMNAEFDVVSYVNDYLPTATMEGVNAIDWLKPTYIHDGKWDLTLQTFLIETPTHKFVIDPGVGNDRERVFPYFNNLQTDYFKKLTSFWNVDEVDGVFASHIHIDHVGWNTHKVDGKWVPTFKNARYYFVKEEFEYWQQEVPRLRAAGSTEADAVATWDDSVQPIIDAGLVTLVDANASLTPEIRLVPTVGHTIGHTSILVQSQGESAVITGDMMSGPYQVARYDWSGDHEYSLEASNATRQGFLDRFADTSTVVIGSHFSTPAGGHVIRENGTYRFVPVEGAVPEKDPFALAH